MKKTIGFIVIAAAILAFVGCGGGGLGGLVDGKSYKSEGWIDDDTYRTAAIGVPKKGLTSQLQRKATAKEAAKMAAQFAILEKFKGAKVEGAAGMQDFELTGIAVAKEVEGIVKGGSVVSEKYNDDDECEIIYEVRAKGLKKKVQSADIK
ncbi:MAG: hypothetical protein FWG13_06825 [Leptospirales bacterium]|nr:hypothetical protein [Leptospirales bacterium]